MAAIAYASLMPGRFVPRLLYSYHLEHFAAFYVAALISAAAFPRTRLRKIGVIALILAVVTREGADDLGPGLDGHL
jgi:hypothetical protein